MPVSTGLPVQPVTESVRGRSRDGLQSILPRQLRVPRIGFLLRHNQRPVLHQPGNGGKSGVLSARCSVLCQSGLPHFCLLRHFLPSAGDLWLHYSDIEPHDYPSSGWPVATRDGFRRCRCGQARCPRASGSHPYSPDCVEQEFSEVRMQHPV